LDTPQDLSGYVLVTKDWYAAAADFMNSKTCPFCNSKNVTLSPGDDMFKPQLGCLDCGQWITGLVKK